jgi:hypothetical protein
MQSRSARGSALLSSFNALRGALRGRRREEAVQGAGMWGPVPAPGAAESDASARRRVRSHVPGTRRDRAQADEAGNKKAEPDGTMEEWNTGVLGGERHPLSPSFHHSAIPLFQRKESAYGPSSKKGSAHEPSPLAREWHGERLRRAQVVEIRGSRWVQMRPPTPLNYLFAVLCLPFSVLRLQVSSAGRNL